VEGKRDAAGRGLDAQASLANDDDLYVGGAPNGHYLNIAIDFVRIARGTVADSKTFSRAGHNRLTRDVVEVVSGCEATHCC
jgi:hypothetical protein